MVDVGYRIGCGPVRMVVRCVDRPWFGWEGYEADGIGRGPVGCG